MTRMILDPERDLVIERVIDAPVARVWEAWTRTETLEKWWCPAPYRATDCVLELRPGGAFSFVIRSPEGETFPYAGCVLEVETERRIVWTVVMGRDYRPNPVGAGVPVFTADITFEAEGEKTRYRAVAHHADATGARTHAEMGFHEGWGAALDQLAALVAG